MRGPLSCAAIDSVDRVLPWSTEALQTPQAFERTLPVWRREAAALDFGG